MPGKSRHGKRKHPSRRRRWKQGSAITAQRQTLTQTQEPVSQPKVSAPSVSAPTPLAAQTAAQYPYIATELRRIGILAGIVLAVLVVLALVLS